MRNPVRIAVAVASAAATLSVAVPGAQAATAQCVLTVPSKIAVHATSTPIPVKVTGACVTDGPNGNAGAAWAFQNAQGQTLNGAVFFPGAASDNLPYPNTAPVGLFRWAPAGATDDNNVDQTQNSAATAIKYTSLAYVSSARTGGKVTLSTHALRYASSKAGGWWKWAGAKGQLQFLTRDGKWAGLKDVVTDSTGNYSYSFTYYGTRTYRVVYFESPGIWGRTSTSTTR